MSTNYGLRCLDHDPPLDSEHWAQGSAAGELEKLHAALRVRGEMHNLSATFLLDGGWGIQRWFEDHPRCRLQVVSEYGEPIGEISAAGHQIAAAES